MTETLFMTDIEGEILRLSATLEGATEELAKASLAQAEAEADFKDANHWAFLGVEGTEKARVAEAHLKTQDLYRAHVRTEAIERSLQEKCRSLRAQLSAVQTLSANVRSQGG